MSMFCFWKRTVPSPKTKLQPAVWKLHTAYWFAQFIGQSPGLSGFLTARENVELRLAIRGIEGLDAYLVSKFVSQLPTA